MNNMREKQIAFLAARTVARKRRVPEKTLFAYNRQAKIVEARHIAIYLTVILADASYATAGSFFSRDRATVRYACHKIEDKRESLTFDCELAVLEHEILTTLEEAA